MSNQMQDPKAARADAKAAKARAKALRPWYRKKRFWLLGIVVLIVVIIFAANAGGGKKSATDGGKTVGVIGQTVKDGNLAFVVKSVDCGATASAAVGGGGFGEKVPSSAQECLASVTVTADKGDGGTYFSGNQYAHDGADRKFKADTEGAVFIKGQQDNLQINPGISVSVKLPFQIPKNDSITSIELHDSAFSNGATVNL